MSKVASNLRIISLIIVFCSISTLTKAQPRDTACMTPSYHIDIPLTTATAKQLEEIDRIYNKLSDRVLGEVENKWIVHRTANAIRNYDDLDITITDGNISGNLPEGIRDPHRILLYFAQYIKFRPTAAAVITDEGEIRIPNIEEIKQRASNLIRLSLEMTCTARKPIVRYSDYREFMDRSAFLLEYISDDLKVKYHNLLSNFGGLNYLWKNDYYLGQGVFDADVVRNTGIGLVAYAKFIKNDDEKVRWMKGINRFMRRCFTYTERTSGGIKPDGSGYHHQCSYPGYMEDSYRAAINILASLDNTSFQVSKESYLIFRDAVYYQIMIGNDAGLKPFSMVGRGPNGRHLTYYSSNIHQVADLAIVGGNILGLTTPDPVLAGLYNRIAGTSSKLTNYTKITPFEEGYIQLNQTEGASYRKDNYVVFFNGFSSSTYGIEAFENNNLFGRYQSYGAMEILVPGYTGAEENGYHVNTWNWNYNPGATTIVLPWEELQKRQNYGSQQKRFVGSLALKNKGNPALTKVFGTYGLFAMDFKEDSNKNPTFTFKKSNFTFSDMIVCLGSNINNNNRDNPTVTTLYQRLANSRNGRVDRHFIARWLLGSANHNWIISNANNGFYVVDGGRLEAWEGTSPTGDHREDPGNITLTTDYKSNTYAYIDHGRAPSNAEYEYICIPKTTSSDMDALEVDMKSTNNRPYIVHQKNANAHIVEHKKDKIWAYSLFTSNSNIEDSGSIIKSNNKPCLAMYQKTGEKSILLSIANPDLGYNRKYWGGDNLRTPNTGLIRNIRLTLRGRWDLTSGGDVSISYKDSHNETYLDFTLSDGLPAEVNLVLQDEFGYGGYDFLGVTSGDYDGDGTHEVAVYRDNGGRGGRPSGINNRVIIFEADGTKINEWSYGGYDFLGITSGDYDGDGTDEVAVYRDNGGRGGGRAGINNYVIIFEADGTKIDEWSNGNKPFQRITSGDYDGDGTDELAVYREDDRFGSTARIENRVIIFESNGLRIGLGWSYNNKDFQGITSGDYDGDGTDGFGVYTDNGSEGFHPVGKENYMITSFRNHGRAVRTKIWSYGYIDFQGITSGDYNGDGTHEVAVYYNTGGNPNDARIVFFEPNNDADMEYAGEIYLNVDNIQGIASRNLIDGTDEIVTIRENKIRFHRTPFNRPPVISLPLPNENTNDDGVEVHAITLSENEAFVVDIDVINLDEDILSYALKKHDSAFFQISDTGILRFKDGKIPDFENPLNSEGSPDANGDQNYLTVVTVTDVDGLSDSIEIRVTIENVNEAPTITGTPPLSIAAGTDYLFSPIGADPEGDTLVYSLENNPSWLSIDSQTGELSGTPTNENAGITTGIVITVSDGEISTSLPAFNLKVAKVITQVISLSEAWNLVGFNVDPLNNSVANIFASYENLMEIRSLTKSYHVNVPSFLNTLTSLENSQAYYIQSNESVPINLTGTSINLSELSLPLSAGWNLISYPSENATSIEFALRSILADIVQVISSQGNTYRPDLDDFLNTLRELKPGEGYWIEVSRNCTLTF